MSGNGRGADAAIERQIERAERDADGRISNFDRARFETLGSNAACWTRAEQFGCAVEGDRIADIVKAVHRHASVDA